LSNLNKVNARTKVIALIAIFSSLYAALRLVPTVPMIGAQGASFSLSDVLASLYGILLGPFTGGFSVVIGTFVAMGFGKPVIFLGLDFLPALVNAVALGLLVRRKWLIVVALNIVLLVGFLLNPLTSIFISVGGISFPFVWLHIAAFIVLLSPLGRKAGQWVETLKPTFLAAGISILAFVGTMMQHLTGGILTEVVRNQIYVVLGQPPIVLTASFPITWSIVFFLYPWERLGLIILAVVVGTPLVRALKKSLLRPEKQAFTDSKQDQKPPVTIRA